MSIPIHTKEQHLDYLQNRFELMQQMIAGLPSEEAGIDDLERLEQMLDNIMIKIQQFKPDWKEQEE